MKKRALVLLILPFLFVYACKDDDDSSISSIYEGCCSGVGIDQTEQKGLLAPNIFTPNLDGRNDIWYVQSGPTSEIVQFSNLEIFDKDGNLIFYRATGVPNDPSKGWDGSLSDGEQYVGKFSFSFEGINWQWDTIQITGSSCAVDCDLPISTQDSLNCMFGLQFDGDESYDMELDSGEEGQGCIEWL